jgi:hypothetical protein
VDCAMAGGGRIEELTNLWGERAPFAPPPPQAPPHTFCARAHGGDRLRVHVRGDEDLDALAGVVADGERDGLGRGRGLIQQRRVGGVHARHVRHLHARWASGSGKQAGEGRGDDWLAKPWCGYALSDCLTIVWKLSSDSRRPWLISAWYGVYDVYQPVAGQRTDGARSWKKGEEAQGRLPSFEGAPAAAGATNPGSPAGYAR